MNNENTPKRPMNRPLNPRVAQAARMARANQAGHTVGAQTGQTNGKTSSSHAASSNGEKPRKAARVRRPTLEDFAAAGLSGNAAQSTGNSGNGADSASAKDATAQQASFTKTPSRAQLKRRHQVLMGVTGLLVLGLVYIATATTQKPVKHEELPEGTVYTLLPSNADSESFRANYEHRLASIEASIEHNDKAHVTNEQAIRSDLKVISKSIRELQKSLEQNQSRNVVMPSDHTRTTGDQEHLPPHLQALNRQYGHNRSGEYDPFAYSQPNAPTMPQSAEPQYDENGQIVGFKPVLPNGVQNDEEAAFSSSMGLHVIDMRESLLAQRNKKANGAMAGMNGMPGANAFAGNTSGAGMNAGYGDNAQGTSSNASNRSSGAANGGNGSNGRTPAPLVLRGPSLQMDSALNTNRASGKSVEQYLPAGSFSSATLLTGVYAATGPQAPSTPSPVLMKLDGKIVLPNKWHSDLNNCVITGNATGDLSSERILIRMERLSCVRQDSSALDIRVSGFVSGEDGKVGVRGRVVNRNGKAIATAMSLGLLGGIGEAISLSAKSTTESATLGMTTQVTNPWKAGLGKGSKDALDHLTDYYLKLAEHIFPIIEVDTGRKVNVVFSQGTLLDN